MTSFPGYYTCGRKLWFSNFFKKNVLFNFRSLLQPIISDKISWTGWARYVYQFPCNWVDVKLCSPGIELRSVIYKTATGSVRQEKVFLEISGDSLENTSEFCKISKNTLFPKHIWATASVYNKKNLVYFWRTLLLYPTNF